MIKFSNIDYNSIIIILIMLLLIATPPFELVSMSPVPIVSNFLYSGAWDPLKNRKIDYCIFPMSLSLESEDVLLISFGRNDHEGWIANMNLHSLLDSLDPISKIK